VASATAQDTTPIPNPTPVTPTAFDDPELVQHYQATITPEDLAAHLYFFASDFFEGRETATHGQKLAANYLASQYRKMGLAPKGTAQTDNPAAPENYFQPFPLYGRRFGKAQFQIQVDGQPVSEYVISKTETNDDVYLASGSGIKVDAPVVFAGYGIADKSLGYDDYAALEQAGIDYKDKWLLILEHEPLADAETSLLPTPGNEPSEWTTSRSRLKQRTLYRKGLPKGILIVGDAHPGAEPLKVRAQAAVAGMGGVSNLSLEEQTGGGFVRPPVYVISSKLADQILKPTGKAIAEIKAGIDQSLTPNVFELGPVQIQSELTYETVETSSENVLAFIEGSDPELKHEVVLVTSHYDHEGIDPSLEGDQIYNGADDDGSGTVTVLEIAEAFQKAVENGHGPRRSILFMNVSGEEKGLLGSAYYADSEPVVPIENTVTNLNIDMIGRYDPTHPGENNDYVYIIGSNLISQELHDINARVNELTGIDIDLHERFNSKDDPNQFYRRSDHWNFGKHSIPFIFFFTGTHEDYHGVDDEPEKIEYDRMARIGRVIFATAWQVANQDTRPVVSGTGFN
jgi:hypothetical protein